MYKLSNEELRRHVPAVFAEAPAQEVSHRYGFVPTIDVINAFESEGWYPVRAEQTLATSVERMLVARHLIRFRQDVSRQVKVGDTVAELVLTNSHDRSSAYQLDLGLFRLVCMNGMVTPIGKTGGIRVRHGKNIVVDLVEGSVQLINSVPIIASSVNAFQSTPITEHEASLYAEAALEIRYGEEWHQNSPIAPRQILQARRMEDRHDGSLWGVFNRTQENLLKGGLQGRAQTGRSVRTRPIRSVAEDVRLNRSLWRLTERFAELKGVAVAA